VIRGCGMLPPLPVRPGNHRARPLQRTLPGITGVTTASITRAVQKTDSLVRWMTMHRMKRCPPSNNGTNGTMSPSSAPLLRSAARPSKAIMSWVPRQWPMSLRSRAILNVARYASGRRLLHVTRSRLACRHPRATTLRKWSHLSGGGTIIEISSGRKTNHP
jgi:hypothetical protein